MNFTEYLNYFESILKDEKLSPPYTDPDYLNYTKLNWNRMKRWLKTAQLSTETTNALQQIKEPQNWSVITEPWCGDAAHIVPFIEMMGQKQTLIKINYELRDAPPFSINNYLTNGKSKSIPKLIIRNQNGDDLAVWGPRPVACQLVYDSLHLQQADFETIKIALQEWYNKDQGQEIMKEIIALLLNQ